MQAISRVKEAARDALRRCYPDALAVAASSLPFPPTTATLRLPATCVSFNDDDDLILSIHVLQIEWHKLTLHLHRVFSHGNCIHG